MTATEETQVAIGAVIHAGRILLAKRPEATYLGGLWEFPGGKLQAGEDSLDALRREMLEEVHLSVLRARPLIRIHHDYPERRVILHVWLVQEWTGDPVGREGQRVEWVELSRLPEIEFPPANRVLLKAIQLPVLYLISPGPQGEPEKFLSTIKECTGAGAGLLQLRCNEEVFHKCPELVRQVSSICEANHARLLLNSSPATAVALKAHGVHLNSVRLLQLNERPLDRNFLVSASCHNQSELLHASRIGVDFAVLSPVNKTPTHPEAVPLGWERFSRLAENSDIPVYALGGMRPEHLDQAWAHGAQGVAMLSSVWTASRPADIVRQCNR